jgi:hypothetical protein
LASADSAVHEPVGEQPASPIRKCRSRVLQSDTRDSSKWPSLQPRKVVKQSGRSMAIYGRVLLIALTLIFIVSCAEFVVDFARYRVSSVALENVRRSPWLHSPGSTYDEDIAAVEQTRSNTQVRLEMHFAIMLLTCCCLYVAGRMGSIPSGQVPPEAAARGQSKGPKKAQS